MQNLSTEREQRKGLPLPAIHHSGSTTSVAPYKGIPVDGEAEDTPLPLSHYIRVLRRHLWKIGGFVLVVVLGVLAISLKLTPVHESTATIDIDRRTSAELIGRDANSSQLTDADQFLATQINLIQSDSVLRPVAVKYDLFDTDDQRNHSNSGPVRADEQITLPNLRVFRPPNTYLLKISYRSTNPVFAANVANAVAASYIEHTYKIRVHSSAELSAFMESQLQELKGKMERSSAALAKFERDFGVIDPAAKTNVLSARLSQLNTEYTIAQADRVRKETAWRSVHDGSYDAAIISSQGDAIKKIAERLNEANQSFADVRARLGENHPDYKKIAAVVGELRKQLVTAEQSVSRQVQIEYTEALDRERLLQSEFAETKSQFDRLNGRSFEYKSLQRDAEADKKLYEELTQKIREAGINAGLGGSAIRLADLARPRRKPISPNVPMNVFLAFVLSTLFASAAVIVADALNDTVRDAEKLEFKFNVPVIGLIPTMRLPRWFPFKAKAIPERPIQIADGVAASYLEAIRTLRNRVLLSQRERPLKSILITSAEPREGKTITALNLGLAYSEQGHKTLLVDCDLRRPKLSSYLDLPQNQSLSSVLMENQTWRDAVREVPEVPDLYAVYAGPSSRRAADLIGTQLNGILHEASTEYELVVIDGPPMLSFAETVQMATAVDGVLIIARSGLTKIRAVGVIVNLLNRIRANICGIVINEVKFSDAESYYFLDPRLYRSSTAANPLHKTL